VVAFWLALGGVIAFVAGFTAANQLFQYPWFTIGIGLVIAVMGVAMGGLLSMQLPQWVYRINPRHDTWHGSFGFGIMAAVLSTPCTAPFMGAAAGWAATQTPLITMSTFTAIGVGMALPYALLSAFPQLVERMPRTGPASELIKQVMGLLILGAAAYFVGTGVSGLLASPPDPPSRAYWWVVGLFIAVAGGWLAWRTIRITPRIGRRLGFGGLGVAMILAGVLLAVAFTARSPINWVYYTPERLDQAQSEGKVVVLEFTAEWCLNCHTLEQAVLHRPQVVELFNADDVIPIKIDLTGNNPSGNAKLTEVGRRTIPLLIIYDRQGEEVFRSDAYTQAQVIQAVQTARGG
jgi:thiol:disulfide interchange protein DsbD